MIEIASGARVFACFDARKRTLPERKISIAAHLDVPMHNVVVVQVQHGLRKARATRGKDAVTVLREQGLVKQREPKPLHLMPVQGPPASPATSTHAGYVAGDVQHKAVAVGGGLQQGQRRGSPRQTRLLLVMVLLRWRVPRGGRCRQRGRGWLIYLLAQFHQGRGLVAGATSSLGMRPYRQRSTTMQLRRRRSAPGSRLRRRRSFRCLQDAWPLPFVPLLRLPLLLLVLLLLLPLLLLPPQQRGQGARRPRCHGEVAPDAVPRGGGALLLALPLVMVVVVVVLLVVVLVGDGRQPRPGGAGHPRAPGDAVTVEGPRIQSTPGPGQNGRNREYRKNLGRPKYGNGVGAVLRYQRARAHRRRPATTLSPTGPL